MTDRPQRPLFQLTDPHTGWFSGFPALAATPNTDSSLKFQHARLSKLQDVEVFKVFLKTSQATQDLRLKMV